MESNTDAPSALPQGFEVESQPTQASPELPAGFEIEDRGQNDLLSPLYAGAQGVSQGLIGLVAPWIAKKLGATNEDITSLPEAHPIAHGIGEFGGLAAGLMTGTGVGGLAVKAGEALPAIEGAGYLAKVGNSALKQAAEMTVIGGSDELAKQLVDPNRSAETALSSIGLSAAMGAGTGAFVTGALSPLWKATVGDSLTNALKSISMDAAKGMADGATDATINPIVKKVLSTFGGVSEEEIDAYLKHHADIAKIPEFEEIHGHALDHIGKISDEVEAGKMSVAEAKASYKELESSMTDSLKQSGADATTANRLAQQALKDGQTKLFSDVMQQALRAGDRAAAATNSLRDKVVKASAANYNLLENSSVKSLGLKGFLSKAEAVAQNLEAEGTLEARSQAERIRQYVENVKEQFGESVTGPQAKQLIQGLDKVSKYDFNASTFDKGLSNSYKELRHELDSTLKSAIPEYAKAMKPLAEDAKLLSQLKRYGTEESATTRIKSLKNPDVYKNEMTLLKELEARTGIKFTHEIEPYANPELRAKLSKSLPEFEEAQKTAADLESIKHPNTKRAMEEMLATSEEAKAVASAQQQLEQAGIEKEKIKGLTPQTLQGKLMSVAKPGKSIANEAILSQIPGMEGKSIPEIMNLLRIRDAFEKNATRGSKHVNLYGMMAGALGSMATHTIPGAGVAVGAGSMAGAYVDNNGPKLVKRLLDKYISHYGDLAKLSSEGSLGSAKTMLNRVLGHEGAASGDGFKSGVDYINAVKRGESLLDKSVSNVFKAGQAVLRPDQIPNAADRLAIDKLVAKYEENPNDTHSKIANGKLGDYLPDHHAGMAQAVVRNINYIQSLKPTPPQGLPLDRPLPVSDAQEARMNRAKDIAQQPAIVLHHVKNGTWQSTDFVDLKAMYPAVYKGIVEKTMSHLATAVHDEEPIPYKTRIGISAMLGQPLDSSMLPANIMAAQAKPQQQQPANNGKPPPASSTNPLKKLSNSYKTPGQTAESDRANRD